MPNNKFDEWKQLTRINSYKTVRTLGERKPT
jgi:hypothetical protein